MDFPKLFEKKSFWSKANPYSNTVLSTRVRLIRNIYGIPFPNRQERDHVDFIKSIVFRFIAESNYEYLEFLGLDSIDDINKRYLIEENLINPYMAAADNCFVVMSHNDDFNIMINDEDHFKIQVIKPGLQLYEAYTFADTVDDNLNKFAIYAFSEKLGYITSSLPYNVSFKVSTMLHLPILSLSKGIMDVQECAKLNRLNIIGLKENGFKTIGSIFLLSNNFIPDTPETKIIEILEKVTHKIINLESDAREIYFAENGHLLEDKICRSYGLLRYARKLGYAESMDYLSDIRLGIILSVIKNIELYKINELMINVQWSHLQKIAHRIFNNSSEGDIFRASYIRDQFEDTSIV